MTLKNIIKKEYDTFVNGVAWVVIYKINRSWNYSVFYHEDGSYEDGLIFDDCDKKEMFDILKTDPKAICVNGIIAGFGEDFTVSELEDKIRMFYIQRYHQLNGDFLGGLVENMDYKSLLISKGFSLNEYSEGKFWELTIKDDEDQKRKICNIFGAEIDDYINSYQCDVETIVLQCKENFTNCIFCCDCDAWDIDTTEFMLCVEKI